ncbi:MAG: hypothetical protein AAF587_35470 [Bacteroidota bacterium]
MTRQRKSLKPQVEEEILATLTYKGKIAAIKLYMKHANCRPEEARKVVEHMGQEIEPGQAAC